ncbi:calcium-binding protein [Thalassobacter stenotrophicus]|uniref:calcium-binding protein n=1 Tax=Thalassobacter stenotrophicus TaxID=266809 RepID=UPI0022A9D3A6|nr:calcium-binding protein [Thalassobacter stenotrophicus]UYP68407.1 calcium-binding protein [Thalassobacter stenotrophicus]
MIEVKSNKKTETPGKERLNSMEGLRQTVTAIPKRKIGVAMIAFVGLIAYLKTILGGSEAAAQSAPNGQFKPEETDALICDTDNSSTDNSGRLSYGNAELFKASIGDEEDGTVITSPQAFAPSVSSPVGSSSQPQIFSASGLQAPPLNVNPTPTDPVSGGNTGPSSPTSGGSNNNGGGILTPETPPGNNGTPTDPNGDANDENDADPTPDDTDGETTDTPTDNEGEAGNNPEGECTETPPSCEESPAGENCDGDVCDTEQDSGVDTCQPDLDEDTPQDEAAKECLVSDECSDKDQHTDEAHADEDCDTTHLSEAETQTCDLDSPIDDDCFSDPWEGKGDLVQGSGMNDRLEGTDADNIIYGHNGSDQISGAEGDDLLVGADGDDIITGDNGNDRISGGNGEDYLSGGTGADILSGGAGDDILKDGYGADRLFGDAGNDTIYLTNDLDSDHVSGGEGTDTLYLSASDQVVHVDLAAGTVARSEGAVDTFDGIEILTASDGANVFDLSGFFTPGGTMVSETVFQIRDFGHDDTLVLADDIRLALSDLKQVSKKREFKDDGSDFEARITSFDPEITAEEHGRPGFRLEDQDELMVRRLDLRLEQETGDTEIELWVTSDLGHKQSDDFTS